MSDEHSSSNGSENRSWLDKISTALTGSEPRNREELLEILHDAFSEARATLDLQITVEVGEILRTAYNKYPEGTLSQPPN